MSKRFEVGDTCGVFDLESNDHEYCLNDIEVCELLNNQAKQISDLKAKLAESEEKLKAMETLREMVNEDSKLNFKRYIDTLAKNEQLEQQLAENESEIAIFKKRDIDNQKQLERQMNIHKHYLIKKDQDKISFALKQLEKVKEFVSRQLMITIKGCRDLDKAEAKGCNELRADTIKEIDNQIKQLKEMM